jgi:CheY-like chemotaxis protein
MPDGGLLIIKTELVELDNEFIKEHGYGKLGMFARIVVADTGAGMDEETRRKIFEPFFTTKEVGKGTGLGLAIVYGTIKQHNGYINVYSTPGEGTTFTIYLPVIKVEIEETRLIEHAIPTGGTETVLVAEDDAEVRKLIKSILDGFGYAVIEAVDGEDAINKFMENKDRIQLLLLDVIMPKKSGKVVYEEIRQIRPDIKTLFASGYAMDIIQKIGILEEGLNFVLKPLSPKELLRKVREVLDK